LTGWNLFSDLSCSIAFGMDEQFKARAQMTSWTYFSQFRWFPCIPLSTARTPRPPPSPPTASHYTKTDAKKPEAQVGDSDNCANSWADKHLSFRQLAGKSTHKTSQL
jgi:hypothetical protein